MARSVLLASGTLAPLASFAAELRLPFPTCLENPHVIDTSRQVLAGVVAKGVTGKKLNSSFQNRETTEYKLELGRTLSPDQSAQLFLPIKLGGCGLQSATKRRLAAFLGSWELCFAGVCAALGSPAEV